MGIKNNLEKIVRWAINYKFKTPQSCLIHRSVVAKRIMCEGYNRINSGTHIYDTSSGYNTTIGMDCKIYNAKIGRYCSIGNEVSVVVGRHPTRRFVSTSPAFYSTQKHHLLRYVNEQLFEEYRHFDNGKSVIIGNDVWIGSNSIILEGIRIGDGAIIAAGSVVVKDVDPYCIVGGNPASFIRKRFDQDSIDELCCFKWWDKSEEWLKTNARRFSDIDEFINNIKK